MDMADYGLDQFREHGNFSRWVDVGANEAVMVSGLTSCGAILYANHDFSKIAAGHMSGDSRFVEGWCKTLGQTIKPWFLLFASGPDGGRKVGGRVLMQYMKAFDISPSRAPAVADCGAIFLTRTQRGVAYASHYVRIECNRRGQAIRKYVTLSPEAEQFSNYHSLTIYNERNVTNVYLLLMNLPAVPGITFGLTMNQDEMTQRLAQHGKKVVQAYLTKLPTTLKADFLHWELFKMYPDWKT